MGTEKIINLKSSIEKMKVNREVMDAVMSQSQQKNQLKPKSNFLDAQEQLNMLLSNGIENMAANSKRKSSKDGRQPEVGGRTRNTMNP